MRRAASPTLEQQYTRLGLEEDRLYAHGFMPWSTWRLLHPRIERRLSSIEKRVLEIAVANKRIHPRDLADHFERKTVRNGWGSQSRATTQALHTLHFGGFLRVAEREGGERIYEPAMPIGEGIDSADRFRQLLLVVVSLLGPISEKSLRTTLGYMAYRAPGIKGVRSVIPMLVKSGELASRRIDGMDYLWPTKSGAATVPNLSVRFLSPFDPLIWDRMRFEHFWGWRYRFEAYVPPANRKLGYYAMPILWRDEMIGWVNASNHNGKLVVERGFTNAVPTERTFESEFQAEVARLERFLRKRS